MNALQKGAIAAVASLALHAGVGVALGKMAARPKPKERGPALQVAVVEKPKPPPPPPPPKPVEPKKPPPPKKIVTMMKQPPQPVPPPPVAAPPPPTQEAKKDTPPPPVLLSGITLESTSAGGSFAVATGNSLSGDPGRVGRDPKDVPPARPYKAARYAAAAQVNELPDLINKADLDINKYYPPEAKRKEFEGEVVTRLLIDSDGTIAKVDIISDPGEGLGAAALKAVKDLRFKPGKVNGEAVATTIPFTFHFELH